MTAKETGAVLTDAELSHFAGGWDSRPPVGPEFSRYYDDSGDGSCRGDIASGWNDAGFGGAMDALLWSPNCGPTFGRW
jgi:hypothetical protein